ncbi:MAG: TolC family protein [bacterium]
MIRYRSDFFPLKTMPIMIMLSLVMIPLTTDIVFSESAEGDFDPMLTDGMSQPADVLVLDLKSAFRLALEHNSEIQRADLDVQSSRIGLDQAERQYHPSLSLSGSTSARWSDPSVPGADSVTHSANVRLGSNYTLFNGFTDSANRDAARIELAGSEQSADRVAEGVLFQVIGRFLSAAAGIEQIQVQKENLYAQHELLSKIEAFYASGVRPIADVYQQQAEAASAEFRLLNVERDFELKKLALLDQLGLSAGRSVQIDPVGLEKVLTYLEPLPDPEKTLADAKTNRADYVAAKAVVDAAEFSIRAASGGFWPNVSLSMDAGSTYSNAAKSSWTDQLVRDNPYAQVGLSVNLPLYDRYQTRNAVASADIRYRRALLALQDLERKIEKEVLTAYLEYRTAQKQLESAQAQIIFTERALENYEQRYTVNAATLLEVVQARANHLIAMYEKIAAEYNLIEKAVAIIYYAGDMGRWCRTMQHSGENPAAVEGEY